MSNAQVSLLLDFLKECFQFECTCSIHDWVYVWIYKAPYFFFATGLHITLKPLERRHFTEIDIGPCPGNITFCQKSFPMGLNVSVQEDLEIRNQSGILEVPVKKILLVRGLTLDSGDWEVACYAPVWNSSEWTYKSELFTVKGMSRELKELFILFFTAITFICKPT